MNTVEFQIDFPVTDTGISAFGLACTLVERTPEHCKAIKVMLELILRFKPDLTLTDNHGRTPLHLAARCGNETAIDILIDRGFPKEDGSNEAQSWIDIDVKTSVSLYY